MGPKLVTKFSPNQKKKEKKEWADLQIHHVITERDCLWASSNMKMWSLLKRIRDDAVLVIFPDCLGEKSEVAFFVDKFCEIKIAKIQKNG